MGNCLNSKPDGASLASAVASRLGKIVAPNDIYDVDADIFSPNALGAIINPDTLPRLKVKVVAGGAIGTPALLQRSGLGGGGVGQWLRLHPTTAVWGRYDREIVTSTGIPLTTMCDEHLRWRGTDFGFWIETPPMHPSFTAAAMPGFGQSHRALMSSFNQLGVLIGLTRDGAERSRSSEIGRAHV